MKRKIKMTPQGTTDASEMQQRSAKYFYHAEVVERLIQFSYAVTPKNQQLCLQKGLNTYLGYPSEHLDRLSLAELWHPNERKKLLRLEQELLDFAKMYAIRNGEIGISIVHKMLKADGTYISVWRRVYPFLSEGEDQETTYSYGIDVTLHHFGDKLTFQVVKSGDATFDLEMAQRYFSKIMTDQMIHFTERQIEVIRTWSELDSSKLVAERLNIQVRTLETHLKNARKRMGVRRTMDVVMYAKEQGWF